MATTQPSPLSPVIITGGASGIGRACAELLAEAGRPVAIWDLDAGAAEALAEAIAQEHGVQTLGLAVDVGNLDAIRSGVEASRNALGTLGGLVHAAGVSGVSTIEQLTEETWQRVLDINLRAQPFIIQAMLDDLKASPGSAVVGIASINATQGNALNPTYSATKGGMLAMNRALADELANYGVRINSVSPGQIATPMLLSGLEHAPGQKEAFERRILLGRLGEPREVATAVRFLMSDEASYITATELVVDGGNLSSQRG
ncbi:SDR family NAD(P)-dependent oxidoreductase [Parahaliea aestuarii]|uniref:SDR family oxidoreductase n=1 Tax=Parahaliea aestuarii TaxID=1852021 RepID=A0A5C9A1N7_9GAMM|nr:SDR family oxidoreductase [Parahaliea aestuarii]TXS93537.1 SDR family oxidoreductase [Parahaliea aestuarii]